MFKTAEHDPPPNSSLLGSQTGAPQQTTAGDCQLWSPQLASGASPLCLLDGKAYAWEELCLLGLPFLAARILSHPLSPETFSIHGFSLNP